MPGISSNAGQILRRMQQRPQRVRRELSAAARSFAPRLNAAAKLEMQTRIYDVPIPLKASADRKLAPNAAVRRKTTKGKHGAWQRSGALKRAETARVEGPIIILTNNVVSRNNQAYALARNNLGTPAGRAIRTPGVQSVQWQAAAVKKLWPLLLEARRGAVLRGLRG